MSSRRVILPQPPNPANLSVKDWQAQVYTWMNTVKGLLQDASSVNNAPLGQAFVVGSFTTNTTVNGTTTGTDLSNFVSSFIQAMTARGAVSPTVSRRGNV